MTIILSKYCLKSNNFVLKNAL